MTERSNVIEFPTKLHDAPVAQVFCQECGSRAVRLVGVTEDDDSWDVECHNCGNEMTGLKVLWDQHGTT